MCILIYEYIQRQIIEWRTLFWAYASRTLGSILVGTAWQLAADIQDRSRNKSGKREGIWNGSGIFGSSKFSFIDIIILANSTSQIYSETITNLYEIFKCLRFLIDPNIHVYQFLKTNFQTDSPYMIILCSLKSFFFLQITEEFLV